MSIDLPKTFNPTDSTEVAGRPQIFDPALKHYSRAFRPGDPTFASPEAAARWHASRRLATDHVLRALAASPWGEHLVLRGSRLMKAWYGDAAREPGDLDYVVTPATARLAGPWGADPWAAKLLSGVAAAVGVRPWPRGVAFQMDHVATDDIWTYERAEGRRVVFPWRTPDAPGGAVQVDVVFGETLTEPPTPTAIPTADGDTVSVLAATAGESLAWKLLWLHTDIWSQGKDLYDAVISAESVYVPRHLLERKFRESLEPVTVPTADAFARSRFVEQNAWDEFLKEYPWVAGDMTVWQGRLTRALAPTFATCEQPTLSKVDVPAWKTSDVMGLVKTIAVRRVFDRLPVLADALEEAGCDDADVLDHCRAGHPHARNCWVTAWLLRATAAG